MVGQVVPEPFDVRTEHAIDAGALIFDNPMMHGLDSSTDSRSSGEVWHFYHLIDVKKNPTTLHDYHLLMH